MYNIIACVVCVKLLYVLPIHDFARTSIVLNKTSVVVMYVLRVLMLNMSMCAATYMIAYNVGVRVCCIDRPPLGSSGGDVRRALCLHAEPYITRSSGVPARPVPHPRERLPDV